MSRKHAAAIAALDDLVDRVLADQIALRKSLYNAIEVMTKRLDKQTLMITHLTCDIRELEDRLDRRGVPR